MFLDVKSKIPIKSVDRADGLPSGQVYDLVQDRRGIFWYAGPGGLASYDGSRIKFFRQKEGLQTHGLRALTLAGDGRVLIGTDLGVDIVETNGTIRPLIDPETWDYGFVQSLMAEKDRLWLGTARGLLCWTPETGVQPADDSSLKTALVSSLLAAKNGILWAAGRQCGLRRYEDGVWSVPENDDWRQIGACLCLAEGTAETILLGGEKGLVEIDRQGSVVRRLAGDSAESVRAAMCVGEELWLGIGEQLRLYRKQPDGWQFEQTVLENETVNKLIVDSIGNVWGATEGIGVFKVSVLREAVIQPILPSTKAIFSIRRAQGEDFLLGGENGSWKFRAGDDFSAELIEPLKGIKVWDIIEDCERTVWAATDAGLYSISAAGATRRIGTEDLILSSPGRVLLERADGIWVGTIKGLVRLSGDGWEHINNDKGHSFGYVYTLAEDSSGCVWIGTIGNGLWQATESGVKKFSSPDIKLVGSIYDVEVGEDGRIAVLQDNHIIIIDQDGTTRILTETEESVSGWAALWKGGKLWVGSSAGLHEYDAAKGAEMRRVTVLNGLSEWEFTTSRSLTSDDRGRLFCGVNGGLMVVDTAKLDKYRQLPEVKLGQVVWANALVEEKVGGFSVAQGKWTLDVEAFAADFVDEDYTRIEFRLNGFDESWTNGGKGGRVQFSSLPSGDYALEARAVNPLIGKSPATKLFDLRVKLPWWANGWLSIPFAAGEAVLGLIESRRKNQRLLERTAALEQRVKERTAELESAMDALAAVNRELQMVSVTDALTGVANRRNFDETFDRELERARRSHTCIALILIDVDCFKPYNDTYGHLQGDECLRKVAKTVAASLRGGDFLARYGGEEFAIIVPNTNVSGTMSVAERSRQIVENLRIPHLKSTAADYVTISLGAAVFRFEEDLTLEKLGEIRESLITAADAALYQAKEAGRNRVVMDEQSESLICGFDNTLIIEENLMQ